MVNTLITTTCIVVASLIGNANVVHAIEDSPTQNYAEALHKSYLFYESQKSGVLDYRRLAWRSDSCTSCYGPNGEDLTRGYYEAANTMKWGFPYAFMITQNAWNAIEFEKGMRKVNEYKQAQDMVKWGTDYLANAYSSFQYEDKYLSDEEFVNQFKFVGHMGNSDIDFEYFGPPEEFDEWAHRNRIPKNLRRPVYYVDKENPSSEICAESAAAMAAGAVLLKDRDPEYASMLIDKAKSLLRFAIVWQGNYKDSGLLGFKQAYVWYPSDNFIDEISWGAAWIYRATGEQKYLDIAQNYYEQHPGTYGGWGYSWAEKGPGIHLLMMKINGPTPAKYVANARQYFDSWMPGDKQTVEHTPGGLGYIYHWGANRYAANTAMLCLVFRKFLLSGVAASSDPTYADKLLNYGGKQVNYLLGENPVGYSWMVGYGDYYPKRPYHKSSYNSILNYPLRECPCVTDGCDCYYEEYCDCAWSICKFSGRDWEPHRCECKTPSGRKCDSIRENEMDFTYGEKVNQHIVYGALVGSPIRDSNWYASDTPVDNRNDYEYTEVTQDYNAGFTGALAGMVEHYIDYMEPFSDCGLDLGWDHENADPRPDWPENDCYHRCDCTPTSEPTTKPSEPTPEPTPRPTRFCAGDIIENGWTSCLNTPGCCADGLNCYRQNQYWAACLSSCDSYMENADGDWLAWECIILDSGNSGGGGNTVGECSGSAIDTEAENCLEKPGCCKTGTKCYAKDDYWASCKESCSNSQVNYQGVTENWTCEEVGDSSAPTPEPISVNSDCTASIITDGATNCMDNPPCCASGMTCFQKDKYWAACLDTCSEYMENSDGGWDRWDCIILSSTPVVTDPPSTMEDCEDGVMIEDASVNCMNKPNCCGAGTKCFEKDMYWASCMDSCSEYMENGEGNWDKWNCVVLTEVTNTPIETPTKYPTTPQDCSEGNVISDGATDCRSNPSCCASGTACYEKNEYWAACLETCDSWMENSDGQYENWSCAMLNGQTARPTPANEDCDDAQIIYSGASNCMYKPNCCAAGTTCYEKNQWWAACLESCSEYMDNGNGGYDQWSCVELTSSVTAPPVDGPTRTNAPVAPETCEDGESIITSMAENCMEKPGCCASGTYCYKKDQWWAACMDKCENYIENGAGEWDYWSCEVLSNKPTPAPVQEQTNPPVSSGDCDMINTGAYNCMYNPGCCSNGRACYEKNQWWAACLDKCESWMQADNGEWENWSCVELKEGDKPLETDAPTSGGNCSGSKIEEGSENCMNSPNCCKSGSCFKKNEWWAACLPSCVEWMSFDDGATWEQWECTKMTDSTPTPSPSALPAYCPTQSFVQPVRDCTSAPDCCPSGTSCYRKTEGWAECLTQCQAGYVDPWNDTPWECTKVNRQNQVCEHIHQEYSEDCSDSPNCCPAGTKCYRKSEWWAACRPECMSGEVDDSGYSQPWECSIIEGNGYAKKLSAKESAPWFGTVTETITTAIPTVASSAANGPTATSTDTGLITGIIIGVFAVCGIFAVVLVRKNRLGQDNNVLQLQGNFEATKDLEIHEPVRL